MSFTIEPSKTGKPHILYKKYKFRKSYSVKSGDIIWRCLGTGCGATIKTDGEASAIKESNEKHSGQHPVTLRTLTPVRLKPPSASPAAEIAASSAVTSSPSLAVDVDAPATSTPSHSPVQRSMGTPLAPAPTPVPETAHAPSPWTAPLPTTASTSPSTPAAPSASTEPSASTVPSASPAYTPTSIPLPSPESSSLTNYLPIDSSAYQPTISALEIENVNLKSQVTKLNEELQSLLNHTIESDTRLLNYTEEIFVTTKKTDCLKDCAVQCDPLPECVNPRCVETLDIIARLKTTIEVLESETSFLKSELNNCICQESDSDSWTIHSKNKTKLHPISTSNRFSSLSKCTDTMNSKPVAKYQNNKEILSKVIQKTVWKPQQIKQHKTTHIAPRNVNKNTNEKKVNHAKKRRSLPFKEVAILGDSHARHIAGFVQELVQPTTRVSGFCKPGAKLQNVLASSQPPTEGTRCEIIIAGTNDIAAGEIQNVYHHLDTCIATRPANTYQIVTTLPHRHDLPTLHTVNEQIALLNNYVDELALRHNTFVLDINRIERRYYTKHGLHLTMRGKRKLASLVVDNLGGVNGQPAHSKPQRSHHISPPQEQPTDLPRTLLHETFADAVKQPSESGNSFLGHLPSSPIQN